MVPLQKFRIRVFLHIPPIMEILTAYVRKNSSFDVIENKNVTLLAIDIQANESKQNEVSEIKK